VTGRLFRDRISLVWLGLVLASCLSWDADSILPFAGGARTLGAIVLAIAFIKVRYIMLEFMELRHAPLAMRIAAEAWPLAVGTAVILFYLGIGPSLFASAPPPV
jgi:hypothetical protein